MVSYTRSGVFAVFGGFSETNVARIVVGLKVRIWRIDWNASHCRVGVKGIYPSGCSLVLAQNLWRPWLQGLKEDIQIFYNKWGWNTATSSATSKWTLTSFLRIIFLFAIFMSTGLSFFGVMPSQVCRVWRSFMVRRVSWSTAHPILRF